VGESLSGLAAPRGAGDWKRPRAAHAKACSWIAAALQGRQKPVDRQDARLPQAADLDDRKRVSFDTRVVGEIQHPALELLVVVQFAQDRRWLREINVADREPDVASLQLVLRGIHHRRHLSKAPGWRAKRLP